MLTDDELYRVMNPPKLCPMCEGVIDLRRRYEGDEIVHTARICARCGFIERQWPVTAQNDGRGHAQTR